MDNKERNRKIALTAFAAFLIARITFVAFLFLFLLSIIKDNPATQGFVFLLYKLFETQLFLLVTLLLLLIFVMILVNGVDLCQDSN